MERECLGPWVLVAAQHTLKPWRGTSHLTSLTLWFLMCQMDLAVTSCLCALCEGQIRKPFERRKACVCRGLLGAGLHFSGKMFGGPSNQGRVCTDMQ